MTSREGWAAVKIAAEMCGLPAGTRPRTVRYSPLTTHKGWLVGFGRRVFVERQLDEVYVPDVAVERALAVDERDPFERTFADLQALRDVFGL